MSIVLERLGDTCKEFSQPNEALGHYQKCLPIRQHLADANSKNVQSQRELVLVLDKIGDVLYRERLASDAWNSYEAGRRIRQKLVDDEPTNSDSQRELSISFNKLGDVATLMNRPQVAIANFEKSLQICQRLSDADPLKLSTQRELSFVLRRLASVHQRLGNFGIAEKWLQQAVKLASEYSLPNYFPNDLTEIRKAILFGQKSDKTVDNIDAMLQYSVGMTEEQFYANRLVYDATERCIARISEAAVKLGMLAETLAPHIPWSDIRGIGNHLRHDYSVIIRETIWAIVSKDASVLRVACVAAIAKLGSVSAP